MMKRTIKLKLHPTPYQAELLRETMHEFNRVCHLLVPRVQEHRCWNNVALHHFCYYDIRKQSPLGSQMVCQAIRAVCDAYKTLKANGEIKKAEPVPAMTFKPLSSVQYDHRTYSIKDTILSINTIAGREKIPMAIGAFHHPFMTWVQKSGELCYDSRKKQLYFHLVVETDDPPCSCGPERLGVDLGENNALATSTGTLIKGATIRDRRDRFLSLRRRLQSKGTPSAKRHLKRLSGKEHRWMTDRNHVMANAAVREAINKKAGTIVLEDLTDIRQRITARKRVRTRLHRWAFQQLQTFITYKADAVGIRVVNVNPAYTSQTCSACSNVGVRSKHLFSCPSCGARFHADINAARNLVKMLIFATGHVNARNVDASERRAASSKTLVTEQLTI